MQYEKICLEIKTNFEKQILKEIANKSGTEQENEYLYGDSPELIDSIRAYREEALLQVNIAPSSMQSKFARMFNIKPDHFMTFQFNERKDKIGEDDNFGTYRERLNTDLTQFEVVVNELPPKNENSSHGTGLYEC